MLPCAITGTPLLHVFDISLRVFVATIVIGEVVNVLRQTDTHIDISNASLISKKEDIAVVGKSSSSSSVLASDLNKIG